jgi:antitoxin component of MazEF toxin-antitoxin module
MKEKQITTKISKWGNGFGVRIPASILRDLSISEGTSVTLNSDIKVSPEHRNLESLSIKDIYKNFSPSTIAKSEETFFGKPKGNEIW